MGTYAQALHGLKVCVIPNPDNDFRPLALRHRTLSAVTALLLIVKIVAASAIALIPAPAELSTITSARIVELANVERKKKGASVLRVNSLLSSAAQQKAQHMLDNDYFAHISPDGVTPWFWMAKVGYAYEMAGENLAIDFTEAEDVVAAWLASPSHRDNMLQAAYTETAVAVATGEFQGGTSIVVVHMFGKGVGVAPTSAEAPSSAKASVGKSAGTATTSPVPIASATPKPTPLPTPVPGPADDTPPGVPRIAIVGETTTVKLTAEIAIEGDPESTVRILVNNQVRHSVSLPASGEARQQVNLAALPEGTVILRAYAVDSAGNESEVGQALALTKDTLGPLIDEKALAFALLPNFDSPTVILHLPNTDFSAGGERAGWIVAGAAQAPLSVTLADEFGNQTQLTNLVFTPQLLSDVRDDELTLPPRFQQFSRRLAAGVAAILVILLILSILIRIRIQRPALIAHASLVIALAFTLFLI